MAEDNFIRDFIVKALGKIVKRGSQFCVVSKDGKKNFGCFPSRKQAQKRLQEIEFFKRRDKS